MASGWFKLNSILLTAFVFASSMQAAQAQETAAPSAPAAISAVAPATSSTSAPVVTSEATPPATTEAPPEEFIPANITWMMTSSMLVLMMTLPGLALFYGGLVRKKNILSVMMQCIFLAGIMSVVWFLYGYSLAFGSDMFGGFVGGFDYVCFQGIMPTIKDGIAFYPVHPGYGIPRLLFAMFQMTFFIITPALICGAYAERMKFSAMVIYSVVWGTFVYCPIAHWVWSDTGWLCEWNAATKFKAIDFAGGTVVHISSGVSALVCCLMLGRRLGYGQEPMFPHNLTYTFIGTALLWCGWFGFNAGSALSAGTQAVNAFVVTHMATCGGVIAWSVAEWVHRGKPSILGACSGAVAGLVCVTPASGSAPVWAGIILGLCAGFASFFACTTLKSKLGYDDSLDVFGVHGVSGILGAILTGVFASATVRAGEVGLLEGNPHQLFNQLISIGASAGLAIVGSVVILKIIDMTIGIRVTQNQEIQGLDLTQHGEEGYIQW